MFDLIAHSYGHSFEQIFDMTMRQIQIAIERISTRDHNAFALQAALFGHKIKRIEPKENFEDLNLSQEETAALDQVFASL